LSFPAKYAIIILVYQPKYTINNNILKNIGVAEAARAIIENAPLIPLYEKKFQDEARIRTVHFGTHLEGNELSLTEAAQVIEGQKIVARERDIQEVINYRNVLKYLDGLEGRKKESGQEYLQEQIKKIHALTCSKILPDENCGRFRQSQVVIRNSQTGEIAFKPPPADEVLLLIKEFFAWLNSRVGFQVHPILRAGITHYVLAAIHPFVEGNGRTARAFAILILFNEGYDIKKLFSIEEYFDREPVAYYEALQAVSNQDPKLDERDLTPWLEYFVQGVAIELNRVKERVQKLSLDVKIKKRLGQQIALSERQIKLVEHLEEFGEITTAEAKKVLPMISDDTILRDLKELSKKGIVKKIGKTKAAKYVMK